MKKAIVDIDGVLNYYPDTWLQFLKDNYYYTFVSLSEAKSNLSYHDYKRMKEEYRLSDYKNKATPRKGAKKVLNYLHQNDYLIYIVTARPLFKYNLLEKTIEWLRENELYYDYIYCSQKKDFTVFEKFGHVDVVIDDNCDNINQIKSINGEDCLYINIENIDNADRVCEGFRTRDMKLVLDKLVQINQGSRR